jgi:cobalt/nickel transport system permease protein
MHMADALVSPMVGGTLWAVSATAVAYSSQKIRKQANAGQVPLMGVLGAFLFAAQMINFTIPGTGSSGHLGGGLLLAILLGPHAALLAITSVLMVQAFFFADGGLLALGCNIFNMGIIPAYLVYPLLYLPLAGRNPDSGRRTMAIILSALVALQLGPFSVVTETLFSGISALPFSTFLLLMLPIHLAIGLVEGVITVAVVSFVYQARPEILQSPFELSAPSFYPLRYVLIFFVLAAAVVGGIVSLYASSHPDGLEWAIQKVTGSEVVKGQDTTVHRLLGGFQERVALLPDYTFKKNAEKPVSVSTKKLGTSLAGIVGGIVTLLLLVAGGFLLNRSRSVVQDK